MVTVILILFAGFQWMTAAGNGDKIDKAKQTLSAAVIGLAIIMSAYSLTAFVMKSLMSATGL